MALDREQFVKDAASTATIQTPQGAPPGAQESTSTAPPRVYAKKYPSPEELEKGYEHLQVERNRTVQKLEAELAAQQRVIETLAQSERMSPADRSSSRESQMKELIDAGVPIDPVRSIIQEELNRALAPLAEGLQARSKMEQLYPEFVQEEANASKFVNSDPALSARYQEKMRNNPVDAMEWALLTYQLYGTKTERQGVDGAAEAAAAARRDAGLPGTGTPGSRVTAEQDHNQRLATAYERAMAANDPQGPDMREFLRLRLEGISPTQPSRA